MHPLYPFQPSSAIVFLSCNESIVKLLIFPLSEKLDKAIIEQQNNNNFSLGIKILSFAFDDVIYNMRKIFHFLIILQSKILILTFLQ